MKTVRARIIGLGVYLTGEPVIAAGPRMLFNIGIELLPKTFALRMRVNDDPVNLKEIFKMAREPRHILMIGIVHIMSIAN